LNFAEQQRQAHRERQRRLCKIAPVHPAASGPMASAGPAPLPPEPRATAVAELRGRSNARSQIDGVTPGKKDPWLNDEWRVNATSGVRAVIRTVAKYYSVSVRDIVSHRRTRKLIRPRHVAMYLAHEGGRYSLAIIGGVLGRDHTTIMHACRRIVRLREQDPELDREIRVLLPRMMPETRDE
jgi:hypothetical protein